MRIVLQDKPIRITVSFPETHTQEQVDTWLAKYWKDKEIVKEG